MFKSNLLENLKITLDNSKIEIFENYIELFLEKNSKLNLISKNDEQFLFEKHIFDSLALNLFGKLEGTLLDIGTGGGFPSVPLAILYDNLNVTAIDSIRKKINAVEDFKNELNLKNLKMICNRVENLNEKYDFVVSRAVASLDKILEYSIPHVKKGGYFIAYKSKKYEEEINKAQYIIKKYELKTPQIISYNLPLNEVYERYLVIFKI